MPISFASIPSNWRMPLWWAEIDSSRAGLPFIRQKSLLVGVMTTAGTATANVPVPCQSQTDANNLFGVGSELANMFKAFLANAWANEVWGLPMAESAGNNATGTILVANPPTAAGTLHLYIAGVHVPVAVTATYTAIQVATAAVSAINALTDLPVTAANSGTATITLTCKWKGTSGNDITMQHNYYGTPGGESMPVGITLTISGSGKMTGGTVDPVFTTAISYMGEDEFEFVAIPYSDSTTMAAFEAEYNFSDTGRWGWLRQKYGHLFTAVRGELGDLQTWAGSRNAPQLSAMAVETLAPSPVYEWAAAYTAKAARALTNDPARPLQTLHLEGILPAHSADRFLLSELNILATAGVATQTTKSDNVPMIMRETSTYTTNLYGISDDAYTDVTTLATLARLLRNQRQAITSKFPRHKLANDGTRFGAGQAIVTPKSIKAELVAQYRIDEFNGLVEDAANFKANLVVERDANDPNRVNVLWTPDLVNQLRIFAVLAQFRLQFDRGVDSAIIGVV